MTHRRLLATLASALLAYLVLTALYDPATPFLRRGGSWWVHPEPLSGHGVTGPHRLTYHFTPRADGILEIATMSRLRLVGGGRELLTTPAPGASWKRTSRVEVSAAEPLRAETTDPRWLPAIALAGAPAPSAVEVERDGRRVAAVRAPSLRHVPPSTFLRGLSAATARLAPLVLLAAAAVLARRPRASPTRPASRRHLAAGVVMAHAVVLAWNTAHYPIGRGLDAEGHVEAVELIRSEHRIPAIDRGWQTYHPPLYHALGAVAVELAGGRTRALQVMTAVCGLALVVVIAVRLGARRWRGAALIAFLPVLLVTEPQATNEVLLALLATAAIAVATRPSGTRWEAVAAGALAGGALLTRYSAVLFVAALALTLLVSDRRLVRPVLFLAAAIAIGSAPYISRALSHGDVFVGNWNDELGHPYRQPPGSRVGAYFLSFGSSLVAHPFRARDASLWDALYVSTVSDGFGRFVTTDTQRALLAALPWLALPLAAVAAWGAVAIAAAPRAPSALELSSVLATLIAVAAMVRFNLELPYWSTAKGVFLLGLALPLAVVFERGRDGLLARGGRHVALAIDACLVVFVLTSAAVFTYR